MSINLHERKKNKKPKLVGMYLWSRSHGHGVDSRRMEGLVSMHGAFRV